MKLNAERAAPPEAAPSTCLSQVKGKDTRRVFSKITPVLASRGEAVEIGAEVSTES
jgi:hypothetical protein